MTHLGHGSAASLGRRLCEFAGGAPRVTPREGATARTGIPDAMTEPGVRSGALLVAKTLGGELAP